MATKPDIKLGPKSGKIQRVPEPKHKRDYPTTRDIPASNMPVVKPKGERTDRQRGQDPTLMRGTKDKRDNTRA